MGMPSFRRGWAVLFSVIMMIAFLLGLWGFNVLHRQGWWVREPPVRSSPSAHHTPERIDFNADAVVHKKDRGALVFHQYCAACHGTDPSIVIQDTPRIGQAGAWQQRQGKGLARLTAHVHLGYKNMPAMGGCTMCHEKDLTAAIRYILAHSIPTKQKGMPHEKNSY